MGYRFYLKIKKKKKLSNYKKKIVIDLAFKYFKKKINMIYNIEYFIVIYLYTFKNFLFSI